MPIFFFFLVLHKTRAQEEGEDMHSKNGRAKQGRWKNHLITFGENVQKE